MSTPGHEKLAQALGGALRFDPQLDIIMRLSTFVESREEVTGLHVYRIVAYTQQIGRQMGLDAQSLSRLVLATPTHDIGKLGVPGRILFKPGKLDPEEWEIMKTHTTTGARILEGSGFSQVQEAEQVALCHHEKYDGSGYPSGLVGDSIPLCARIVAVADVYDALTTSRSYKKAYPHETAMKIILEGASTHFDPGVVQAFDESQGRIHRLQEVFEEVGAQIPLYRFAEFLDGRR